MMAKHLHMIPTGHQLGVGQDLEMSTILHHNNIGASESYFSSV